MKIFNSLNSQNTIPKTVLLLFGLLVFNILLAQPTGGGTHPGVDPEFPVPIDGGILMAILAGGGLIAMLFKKKKKEDK